MDFLAELNPAQQEAVTSMNGPVLALAGPGSGKTRALTHRIAYLIRAGGVAPWNIVAVTFTNKAAREMKHRLEQMLTANQVAHLHVGTFHSLSARWLRHDIEALGYYDRNFTIYDTEDQQAVVKRAIRDLDLDEKAWKTASLHHVISKAKNEMITADKFSPRTYQEEIVARVYERYQKVLVENNALDFDDLLLVTLQLLRQNQEIRQKYQQQFIHVMVDEFQDTNMVQYELTKILAGGHRNLFVVGDLDQGVYSWRGADYRNVLRFRQDYPDHKLIRLSQNYRSTDTILAAAKQLIRKNQNRIENDLFTERGVGAKIRVVEAYNEREEASWLVEEIRHLQAQGVALGDMAVMYRTNAQSRLPEEVFIAHNLPYILVRGTSFYQRKEIKDALAYLRLLYNPEDSVSLERIINVPPRAIGAKTIADLYQWAFQSDVTPWQALQQLVADEEITQVDPVKNSQPANPSTSTPPPPFKGKARKALVEFGQITGMLIAAQKKLTLPELYDLTLARTGYKNHIKDNTPEGEERWENLVELRRVTEEFGGVEAEEALPLFLERVALVSDVDALKNEGQAVALLTLHTAKGLEFKAVFMIGMEEGIFPHSRSLADPEQLEEERRLAYVGMTRAKDRLYLVRAFRRASYGFEELTIPSRYLADIPPDLVDDSDRRRRGGSTFSTPRAAQQSSSQWNAPSPTPAGQSAAKAPSYKAGDKVYHSKFGDGVIIGVEREGGEEFVQVAFPGQGIKKLGVSFAPLEKRT